MNYRLIDPQDLGEIFDLRAVTRENPYSREDLRQIGITEESVAERLRRATHRGWLGEVGGKPEFEGKAIGSRLLGAVEEWLASAGWKELWLWTSSDPKKERFHSMRNTVGS